ncbi:MAG: DUF2769 domain-containing protein [Candidatus Altiarchaeia archaeon]
MAKAQKKEMDEKTAKGSCICPSCPSYADCGEKAFCFPSVGKSKCIKKEQGCICPACPVQQSMDYTKVLYCTRGSVKEQATKK